MKLMYEGLDRPGFFIYKKKLIKYVISLISLYCLFRILYIFLIFQHPNYSLFVMFLQPIFPILIFGSFFLYFIYLFPNIFLLTPMHPQFNVGRDIIKTISNDFERCLIFENISNLPRKQTDV